MIGVSVIHSEEQLQDNLCKIKILQVLRPVLVTFLVLSWFLEILFYWNLSWQIQIYVYDIILIANIFNWVNCIYVSTWKDDHFSSYLVAFYSTAEGFALLF